MDDRLYFAHAVNSYDTPYEGAALVLIANVFRGFNIVNPNQKRHQEGYSSWKERTAKDRDNHGGMDYFYDAVLPECTGSVGMPFLDNRFGLGVAGELGKTHKSGKPTYGMFLTRRPTPQSLGAWLRNPVNGLFLIRKFDEQELAELVECSKEGSPLVLGHQETRLRTWLVYNRDKRPYEEAHRVSLPIPPGFYPPEEKK
jgi:hypothetical protein